MRVSERSETHAHVGTGANKGIGNRVDEFTRYSKVANLDLALCIG